MNIINLMLFVGSWFVFCLSTPLLANTDDENKSDVSTSSSPFQPFRKNYILGSVDQGSNEECDAKIQISFLTLFKARELTDKLPVIPIPLVTPKHLNIGFNYTQTSFNDLCASSSPMVSTDYMPGLFLSFQETERQEGVEFKQMVLGWEHQSNGEYEGQTNRSWDRLYAELLYGFNTSSDLNAVSNINPRATDLEKFGRVGDDRINMRIRFAHDWHVSDDNSKIADYFGMAEAELSYATNFTQTSVLVSASEGYKRNFARFEFSTKYIPGLSHINEAINSKFDCPNNPSGFWVGFTCSILRSPFAVFDLKDNYGSWMLQVYDGYGERIRDFNIRTDSAVRFGYRFAS